MPKDRLPDEIVPEIIRRFNYDPETGIISHRVATARGKIGQEAGSIDTCGYRFVSVLVNGSRYTTLAHRAAWIIYYGRKPEGVIDHRDNCKTNNRISNLRDVSHARNILRANLAKRDLPRGISRVKLRTKSDAYTAQFTKKDGKKYYSYHNSLDGAKKAFKEAFVNEYGMTAEEI